MRRDRAYLEHIIQAMDKIEKYTCGIEEDAFKAQEMTQDAVIRQLEIIGEAVKHLSQPLKDNNPDIPWTDIAGMRDKLIHHYFGVDLDVVWTTVIEDLPALRGEIDKILSGLQV